MCMIAESCVSSLDLCAFQSWIFSSCFWVAPDSLWLPIKYDASSLSNFLSFDFFFFYVCSWYLHLPSHLDSKPLCVPCLSPQRVTKSIFSVFHNIFTQYLIFISIPCLLVYTFITFHLDSNNCLWQVCNDFIIIWSKITNASSAFKK